MKQNAKVTNGIKFNSSYQQQNPNLWASLNKQLQKNSIILKDNSIYQSHLDIDDKVSQKQGKKLLRHKTNKFSGQSSQKFQKSLQNFNSRQLNDHQIFNKTQGVGLKNHQQQQVPIIFKDNRCPTSIDIQVIKQCQFEQQTQQLKNTLSKRRVNYESSKLPALSLNKNQLKQQEKNNKKKLMLNLKFHLKEKQKSLLEVERTFCRSFSLLSKTNERQIKREKQEIKKLQQNFKNIYLDKTFLETKINKGKMKQKLLKKEPKKEKKQLNKDRKNRRAITQGMHQMEIVSNKKLLFSKSNDIYKNQYQELLSNFLERQRIKTFYIKNNQQQNNQYDFHQ